MIECAGTLIGSAERVIECVGTPIGSGRNQRSNARNADRIPSESAIECRRNADRIRSEYALSTRVDGLLARVHPEDLKWVAPALRTAMDSGAGFEIQIGRPILLLRRHAATDRRDGKKQND